MAPVHVSRQGIHQNIKYVNTILNHKPEQEKDWAVEASLSNFGTSATIPLKSNHRNFKLTTYDVQFLRHSRMHKPELQDVSVRVSRTEIRLYRNAKPNTLRPCNLVHEPQNYSSNPWPFALGRFQNAKVLNQTPSLPFPPSLPHYPAAPA